MTKKKMINEARLLWILAARAEKRALAAGHGLPWHDFGHSAGSATWTKQQAQMIDTVGLEAWLKTDAARTGSDELSWWPSALLEASPEKKKACNCPPNRCLKQLK